EATSADDEHLRVEDLALTQATDLVHDDVARVSRDALRRQSVFRRLLLFLRGGAILRTPCESRDYGHLVTAGELGLLAVQSADLRVVHIDVDVRRDRALGVVTEVAET